MIFDYKELLIKYMMLVIEVESISFLDSIVYDKRAQLKPEDEALLQHIERIARERLA